MTSVMVYEGASLLLASVSAFLFLLTLFISSRGLHKTLFFLSYSYQG